MLIANAIPLCVGFDEGVIGGVNGAIFSLAEDSLWAIAPSLQYVTPILFAADGAVGNEFLDAFTCGRL